MEIKEPLLKNESDIDSFKTESDQSDSMTIREKLGIWQKKLFRPLTSGSMRGSVFCLLCITFGSGVLTLPYSITLVGLVLALIIFFICAITVYITLILLINVGFESHTLDYLDVIKHHFGQNAKRFASVVNTISNFGSIIVYIQVVSNFFFSIYDYFQFPNLFGLSRSNMIIFQKILFCYLTQVPISLIKDTKIFHSFSIFGTICLMFLVLISIIQFPWYFNQNYSFDNLKLFDFNINIIKVFCMFFFAFGCHNAILNVVNDLRRCSRSNGIKVVSMAFYVEFYVYLIVLNVGYFSTFQNTHEIFIDYTDTNFIMIIGKILYLITLTCHIGTYYYITIPTLNYFLNNNKEFSDLQGDIVCVVSFTILLVIGIVFPSISDMMAVLGATCQIFSTFVVPISLALKQGGLDNSQKIKYSLILISALGIGISYLYILIFH